MFINILVWVKVLMIKFNFKFKMGGIYNEKIVQMQCMWVCT